MTQRSGTNDLDALAHEICERNWGLSSVLERVEVGVNKATWRIGSDAWLSCAPSSQAHMVDGLRALCAAVAKQKVFAVPSFLPAISGQHALTVADHVWWVTEHVPGRAPSPSSRPDMEAVATGMATLHRVLRPLPATLAVSDKNLVTLFEEGAHLGGDKRLGYGQEQREILIRAEACVRARLDIVTGPSMQLVHGDPSNPNLRMDESVPKLTGLIDWDHARVDLVLADLATVAQTVVFRSGIARPLVLLEQILAAYRTAGGHDVTVNDTLTALLMTKFESVAHHGGRYLRGEVPRSIVAGQPDKIRAVLQLIEDRHAEGG